MERLTTLGFLLMSCMMAIVPFVSAWDPWHQAAIPPAGWANWNTYGCNYTDATIRATVDALVDSKLAPSCGYNQIIIQECITPVGHRDPITKAPIPNATKFPHGMADLVDYIHGKGLKAGIYTDVGPETCAGYEGSFGHYDIDMLTYAQWGFDFVEADFCHHKETNMTAPALYGDMRDAIVRAHERTGREMIFYMCVWGQQNVYEWGPSTGTLWRTTGDICTPGHASWNNMLSNFRGDSAHPNATSPGAWQDPDMMVVGMSGLSPLEWKTHFSLWAMVAAPLWIGIDVINGLSKEAHAVLSNEEVLLVDRDVLGHMATQVVTQVVGHGDGNGDGDGEIWVKPLQTNHTITGELAAAAVALFNPSDDTSVNITVEYAQVFPAAYAAEMKHTSKIYVRDLWLHADVTPPGSASGASAFTNLVPPHGIVMLRMSMRSNGAAVGAVASAAAVQGACETSLDCNLNGICTHGTCVCDAEWNDNATCGTLQFQPVPKDIHSGLPLGAYGMSPNHTSWGGNVVHYGDGHYHLYVAEMVEGCGLQTWETNSEVTHAIATSITGPYTKVDVALKPWAHNPQIVMINNLDQRKDAAAGGGGSDDDDDDVQFVLFHIGPGDGKGKTKNCTSSPAAAGAGGGAASSSIDITTTTTAFLQKQESEEDSTSMGGGSTIVHVSNNPSGPWTPQILPFSCNNPAPMYYNHTWYVLCNNGGFQIMSSPGPALDGPWTPYGTKLPSPPPGDGIWEDPFLFVDHRGNWHALAHAYINKQPCGKCDSPLVSGHYFSNDRGYTWHVNTIQPYTHEVRMTDGTSHVFSTRERPKLLFDPRSGRPTHLINGVNPMQTCPPVASVNCKCKPGIDWDYTLIQPLVVVGSE